MCGAAYSQRHSEQNQARDCAAMRGGNHRLKAMPTKQQTVHANRGDQKHRRADRTCDRRRVHDVLCPAQLSELLLEVLPKGLEKFFFTTSGTDANEAAFKIARMYTGKTKIIARYRS